MVDMVIIVDMVDPVDMMNTGHGEHGYCGHLFRTRSDHCLALSKTHSLHVVELE